MLQRKLTNILVTGGCGFIGCNFIHYLFKQEDFTGRIINIDSLTYAGNMESLAEIEKQYGNDRYTFIKQDICDTEKVEKILATYEIDTIVHFAAESHVDRSIVGPQAFIQTNIVGTFALIEAARKFWQQRGDVLFHHISTDEVFGSLGNTGFFTENTPYDPRSPYSASKAASDHLVRACVHTYELPATLSNCSNNYGPYQFPEKLIPLMIFNILNDKPLPVYGDGKNIRDWLYVEDHTSAIWEIMKKGKKGDTYNIGGNNEWTNIDLINLLCEKIARIKNINTSQLTKLITFVKDRPGHDRRYAIDCSKIKADLNWTQSVDFSKGLDKTISWYINNEKWVENVQSGAYKDWLSLNYDKR